MPYIKQNDREIVDDSIKKVSENILRASFGNKKAGILNYTITKLVGEVYGPIENLKYTDFNEIIGVLECCKLEFYRKQCAPYEDIKLKENGTVLGEQ